MKNVVFDVVDCIIAARGIRTCVWPRRDSGGSFSLTGEHNLIDIENQSRKTNLDIHPESQDLPKNSLSLGVYPQMVPFVNKLEAMIGHVDAA